jgi:hypothetical protein
MDFFLADRPSNVVGNIERFGENFVPLIHSMISNNKRKQFTVIFIRASNSLNYHNVTTESRDPPEFFPPVDSHVVGQ